MRLDILLLIWYYLPVIVNTYCSLKREYKKHWKVKGEIIHENKIKLMEQLSVKCTSIEKVDEESYPILEGLASDMDAYRIVGEEGDKYILILEHSNKDIACVLGEDNDLKFGMIDGYYLP